MIINKGGGPIFLNFINEGHVENVGIGRINIYDDIRDHGFLHRVRLFEIKEVMRKMKIRKALESSGISIEVWKCKKDNDLSFIQHHN